MKSMWSSNIRQVKRLFFLLSLGTTFGISHQVSAQDTTTRKIEGQVVENKTGEALTGANVIGLPGPVATQTAEDGRFSLPALGIERIAVSYVGFASDTLNIEAGDRPLTIRLSESQVLDEIVIESRIKSTELDMMSTLNTQKIGSKELMKAACCNLSESFETTPSVDVGFTDAVSGYKQIQMLGLTGAHTAFTRENIPDVRGLATITGLTFTPGAWVESMQLSKGAGSVVNGFEGTAGQINVEWHKPFEEKSPRLYLNGYQSIQGRSEGNLVWNHNFDHGLSTNLLLHGSSNWLQNDNNNDGFLDNPLGNNFVGANRWFLFNEKGYELQAGVKVVVAEQQGGQGSKIVPETVLNRWQYDQEMTRIEAWAKLGKLFLDKPWKSMGLQLSGVYHDQQSLFGNRNYAGKQQSFYANYIYQTILGNTNHVLKGGASFIYDQFNEQFLNLKMKREELVPGAFAEYNYKYLSKLNIVAGLRADYHNLYGAFLTPRLHLRYAPVENSVFRASVGRAQRTPNVFTENINGLASNRSFEFIGFDPTDPETLKPEVAWNMGGSFSQQFMLNYRDGSFMLDYYYTDFQNQLVADIENPEQMAFYNLEGRSSAHSLQAQLDYEPIRNWDVRLAYRYYHIKTDFESGYKTKPLVATHRAFLNTGYRTNNDWSVDYTLQWVGAKRLPAHFMHHQLQGESYTPSFVQMNAQISKSWKDGNFEIYLGAENLTNYMQPNLILGAETPFAHGFDAGMIWGPGMGRNIYAGFRWKLP